MKPFILILMTSALIVLSGCEKKTREPIQPAKYDTKTDAPRSIAQRPANPGILEDQTKVSLKYTPVAPPAPTASAPAIPAESPTTTPAASAPASAPAAPVTPPAAPPTETP